MAKHGYSDQPKIKAATQEGGRWFTKCPHSSCGVKREGSNARMAYVAMTSHLVMSHNADPINTNA